MVTKKATATERKSQARADKNDGPLLDSINAAVKKMITLGKQRGFVTYDELNAMLQPTERDIRRYKMIKEGPIKNDT